MIAYFPTPYEDELLYSVFARYRVHSGAISHYSASKDLFKDKRTLLRMEFVDELNQEVKKILTVERHAPIHASDELFSY